MRRILCGAGLALALAVTLHAQAANEQAVGLIQQAIAALEEAVQALQNAPPPSTGNACEGDRWHPQVLADGTNCGHEHGDQPPLWVTSSPFGVHRSFVGAELHEGFKCAEVVQRLAGGAEWPADRERGRAFVCAHIISTPRGLVVPTHTVETWILDQAFQVSYFRTRLTKGPNIDRDVLLPGSDDPRAGTRPAVFVQTPTSTNHGEQWYPSNPFVNLAWLISQPGTLFTDDCDPETGVNCVTRDLPDVGKRRRIDVQINASELDHVPVGAFCADEFGEIATNCDSEGVFPQFLAATLVDSLMPHFGSETNRTFFADTCEPETCDRLFGHPTAPVTYPN